MRTINLLPKPRQQEIYYSSLLSGLWTVVILSLFSFALVFLVQFGAKFYLAAEAASVSNQIAQLKIQVDKNDNAAVRQQVQAANNIISDYNTLEQNAPKWSKVIKAFAVLPPPGVQITNFTVDDVNKTVTINGLSQTRDLVIELYNNILHDDKNFYRVDYPLDNLVSPTDVNFHFTFLVRDDLLKWKLQQKIKLSY